MATMAATVTGWAHRASKVWYPSSGVGSLSSCPSTLQVNISCPTTTATGSTSSGNKYTIMIAVQLPTDASISSISKVTVKFKPFDWNSTTGTLYGSLRTVSQSNGSTTSDTVSTYRNNAVGSEASLASLGTTASWQSMSFSGSFTQGSTYYLFLYTKSTSDIYGCSTGSSNFSAEIEYAVKTYAVTYNANGGSGAPSTQYKTYNVTLTLSSTKPTKNSTSAGSYTVTLDANGGTCSSASLSAARTTSYTFSKWNTNSSGTGTSYTAGASYTKNSALSLYAIYTSSTSTASVTLPTPTREGYEFLGWATSSTASSGSTGSYQPTADVTLYAIWSAQGLIYIGNEAYQIYIGNGSSWDLYAPYVGNGTDWDLCS